MDMAMAVTLSVHILSQYPVVTWGTDEQRARWLPADAGGRGARCVRLDRTARRVGCGGDPDAGGAGRRRLSTERDEDLDLERPGGRPLPRLRDARIPTAGATRRSPRSSSRRGRRASASGPTSGRWGSGPARRRSSSSRMRGPVGEPPRRRGRGLPDRAVGAGRGADLDRRGLRRPRPVRRWRRRPGTSGSGRRSAAPLAEQQGLRFMLAEMARDVAAARALTRRGGRAPRIAANRSRRPRRWPSGPRRTRRCGWRRTRSSSSVRPATRARRASSGSCATRRAPRSTRAPTRSTARSWPARRSSGRARSVPRGCPSRRVRRHLAVGCGGTVILGTSMPISVIRRTVDR